VSAAFIYAFIPNLNFLSSLAIAACLTPTDPILAAAIVGGKYADKHVPAHLRHILAAESASNDSAASVFLFFALYLTLDHTTGSAIKDWLLFLWLCACALPPLSTTINIRCSDQIVLSVIWGSLLGFSIRHLMKFCERKDLIDRESYVAQYISLALLTVGTSTLLGADDLASFACGTAFSWDGFFNRQTEASLFSSVIDLLLNSAAFVYVGAWMPFDSFSDKTLSLSIWRLICIAILMLLLRRLPIILGLFKWIPDIKSFREALFYGHFGPIGIGQLSIPLIRIYCSRDVYRCHLYVQPRDQNSSAAAKTACQPSRTPCDIDSARCCVHGPLFHPHPRAVYPFLLTRAARNECHAVTPIEP
jgi:NhaP-type Na+/H+ or K+/H+ antiporter